MLNRINISLDTLVQEKFEFLTRRRGFHRVMESIDMALDAGFRHIYIIPMLRRYEMAYELVDYIREREGTLPCPD